MSPDDSTTDAKNAPSAESDVEKLDALKQLLFAQEKADLEALQKQVEESELSPDDISELLPKAVWKASQRDEQLSDALGPMFGTAIKSAIKNDADEIAEAISPIMGPAIRATIQQSIRGMVQSLNKTLEYSVSAKGLKWRWEAFTTGKSFGEVVLLHTLRYRVVQVFLIDRETGLLIKHASMDEAADNIDLASGMLTAIQDFVRDSFGASEDDALSNMSFGNQTVWIETGTHAFLAAVIEGEAPASLRTIMQETVEQIHVRFSEELDNYQGDSAPFAAAQPILDGCIISAFEEDEEQTTTEFADATEKQTEKQPRPAWQKALIAAAVLAALAGLYTLKKRANRRAELLAYENQIQDIRRQLAVPSTIDVSVKDGQLICSGEAHQSWIREAVSLGAVLPEIESVDTSNVVNLDRPWNAYLSELQAEPGLVVTNAVARDGKYELMGMRDPLASDPMRLLTSTGIPAEHVTAYWKPYQSLEPQLVAKRVSRSIPALDSVKAELTGNTLHFNGIAPPDWVVVARRRAEPLAAEVIELNFDGIRSPATPTPNPTPVPRVRNSLAELHQTIERLAPNRQFVLFDSGSHLVAPERQGAIGQLARGLQEVIRAGEFAKQDVRITLVGTAERDDGVNGIELSKLRARAVWNVLQKHDLPAGNFLIQGVGTGKLQASPPGFSEEMSRRCCLFRITVTPPPEKP